MFNDTFQVPIYKGTVLTKIKMLKVNYYNITNQIDNNSIIEINDSTKKCSKNNCKVLKNIKLLTLKKYNLIKATHIT